MERSKILFVVSAIALLVSCRSFSSPIFSSYKPTSTPTSTPSPTSTPTLTPTSTPSPTSTPTLTPTLTPSQTNPLNPENISSDKSEKVLLQVPLMKQNYSLSCEAAASGMAASFYNPDIPPGFSSWEEYIINSLPKDCNPNKGFRGEINGLVSTRCESPYGYGIYADPIRDVLSKAGFNVESRKEMTYDDVKKELEEGHVVIIWISYKNDPVIYEKDPETGEEYPLVYGEHAVVVIGFDENSFYINDPMGKTYRLGSFPRWDDFGRSGLVIKGYKK